MLIYNRVANYTTSQLLAQSIRSAQLVVAREGTPLYDLTAPCIGMSSMGNNLNGENLVGSAEDLCVRLINDSVDRELQVIREDAGEDQTIQYGISAHSGAFIGLASAMAEIIKRNLALCETAAEEIGTAFNAVNQLFSRKDTVVPVNIIPLVGSSDLENAGTFESFARGKVPKGREPGEFADIPTCYPVIEKLDELPILELITVGNTVLDSQLKEWAAKGGAKVIQSIYNKYFAYTSNPETYHRVDYTALSWAVSEVTQLDRAIALLLLACNLGKTSIEPTGGITLEELEFGLTSTRIYAAHVAIMELERLARGRKAGLVVYQYPAEISPFDDWHSRTFDIVVDKVTYDEFISAGGRPEILFGAYFIDHMRNKDDLLARADEFVKGWVDGEATLRRQRHQDEVTRIYRVVRDQCYRDFNAKPQELRAAIDTERVANELDRFNEHLSKTGSDQLYTHLRELYTSIFWSGTEVQELLRAIDEVNPDGQTMSKDAVLRIAIIEYTSRLLMNQTVSVDYHPTTELGG